MEKKTLQQALDLLNKVKDEIHKGLIGQEELVNGLLTGVLADGHILLEGVPGLAKTRAVSLLSAICEGDFKRLQFTPDLLPADIVGTRIYNQSTSNFETQIGPIFANFVLADEINRAPAKVQSALLETMQERQITIGKETISLPQPFFVFATQNPVEQEGTYPLPEAQLDRFLLKLVVDYPTEQEEIQIVQMVMQEEELPKVNAVLDTKKILGLQRITRNINIEDKVLEYIRNLVFATRNPAQFGVELKEIVELGASPRGSISLARAAQARALMNGRDTVYPDDVQAVAYHVLRHRLILTYHGEAEGYTTDRVIELILQTIKVP